MYDFNLLVSCAWGAYEKARREILQILRKLGDGEPLVEHTAARGIIGVRTIYEFAGNHPKTARTL